MPSSRPITFKTLGTSVKYGERFTERGVKATVIRAPRRCLFPRGSEFNITAPFNAYLSVSAEGVKLFEEVVSFAASPQIADWLVELNPGGRQEGHIRIGTKRNYRLFIFSIQKEKDGSWRVSLYETEMGIDSSKLDNETAMMLSQPVDKELARLHGTEQDLFQIGRYARQPV